MQTANHRNGLRATDEHKNNFSWCVMLTHAPTLRETLRLGQQHFAKITLFYEVCGGYLMNMDISWFKLQQRRAGVTSQDLAVAIGRDRSVISRIYHERQPMSFEQAKVFAATLEVPLHEVLLHAGLAKASEAQTLRRGHSESDVSLYQDDNGEMDKSAASFGIDPVTGGALEKWLVRRNSMRLAGFLIGDVVFVEIGNQAMCRQGDVVVATSHDMRSGSDMYLLRRFEPPVIVACGFDNEFDRVHVVDFNSVMIYGRVKKLLRSVYSTNHL
jgi:hypothetical protein